MQDRSPWTASGHYASISANFATMLKQMKSLHELLSELRAVDQNAPGYAVAFENVLAKIIALRSPNVVLPLLLFFGDQSPYDEVMFSIIHGIEVFEDQTYVEQVLRGAVAFCAKSPRWASIVFMRMLNAEPTRRELIRQLREADPITKAVIKNLMEKINARDVQFIPKTTAVIVAAS